MCIKLAIFLNSNEKTKDNPGDVPRLPAAATGQLLPQAVLQPAREQVLVRLLGPPGLLARAQGGARAAQVGRCNAVTPHAKKITSFQNPFLGI